MFMIFFQEVTEFESTVKTLSLSARYRLFKYYRGTDHQSVSSGKENYTPSLEIFAPVAVIHLAIHAFQLFLKSREALR